MVTNVELAVLNRNMALFAALKNRLKNQDIAFTQVRIVEAGWRAIYVISLGVLDIPEELSQVITQPHNRKRTIIMFRPSPAWKVPDRKIIEVRDWLHRAGFPYVYTGKNNEIITEAAVAKIVYLASH